MGPHEDIRSGERKLNLAGHAAEASYQKTDRKFLRSLAAHPDFVLLLDDENRGGARHGRGARRLEATHSPLVGMVFRVLNAGVRAGVFRRGINPVHLYISIAGLSYFFSSTPTLSAVFGKNLTSPAARRARRRHVVDLVLQALRP